MLRTAKLIKPSPSIHNIIIQQQEAKLNNQIKQFFKSKTYPTFPVNDLLALPNFSTDQRFYLLVRELEDWNRRVQKSQIVIDCRAQLYRNKFLFTSLKNIVLNSTKGTNNYQTNLNKLYEWWRKNSKQQMPMYLTARRRSKQDQDWQVRKTFKSNMPLQLRNYERRALFTTQQELNYLHTSKPKQLTEEKLVDYIAIKQYNSKQLKRRQARQQEQIQHGKTLLKSKKSRFLEENCHNIEFFQGKFNFASKTTTFFHRRSDKSGLKDNFRLKNSCSFSTLDKEKDEIQQIKKYRFNSALAKKGVLFQQRDPNLNKTAKSFITTKPFDATVSDFGDTMMTTRKNMLLTKQLSLKIDEGLGSKQQNSLNEQKQNSNGEFMQFNELKNWDGERLMSNPFEKKKQLKKKKKK